MELASDIERFQFEQQAPQVALANYLASVQGGQLGSQQITPYYTNPLASGLSGALGGALLGAQAGFNRYMLRFLRAAPGFRSVVW